MSAHGGSRRQEAQRMGRILRAKKGYFNCYTLKRIPHGCDCMIYITICSNSYFFLFINADFANVSL